MSKLFDIFDGAAQSSSESEDEAATPAPKTLAADKSKKRMAGGAMKNGSDVPEAEAEADIDMEESASGAEEDEDEEDDVEDEDEGQGDSKRRKKEADVEPVLTDTFETAESREVASEQVFAPNKGDEALVLSHNIQHQVALPPDLDYEYIPLSEHKAPDEPARTWPFKLDPFQSLSVASIERDESVLVSAHTSAGKTVVAEYAIAQCLKRNQRVIYTSPIKALSNQKYRDFEAIFGDVGLMTGDVTINPTASCLVMTTEILRSMLYRGSEIMREVGWVIFDEVHYMRDKSRGVVWEETIILLPDKVRYVFLSATIPNAFQFAEWIAKIHHQACHVVYTDFRPTPLQNYFFPNGGEGIYLVVDEKSNFKESNFNLVMEKVAEKLPPKDDPTGGKQKGGRRGARNASKGSSASDSKSDISKIIRMIMKKNFSPVIVFNFSKREVEALALQISHFVFNSPSEQQMVAKVFNSAIESLSEADRDLPQIKHLLPLLQRGIGVHHSGLLPILKETIEILFQESLIKVLFATETFSIGLNMPAKTVVFTKVSKWDGIKERPLTTSEYIQMSGRAGRRGLDTRGIVIMMIDATLEPEVAKEMVVGRQDSLNSAFYLSYNMILNLLRIDAVSPEFMLERCFHQFQTAASVPALERQLIDLQKERENLSIPDEQNVKDYYNIRKQLDIYTKDMLAVIQHPNYCIEFMQPGRLVLIHNPKEIRDDDDNPVEYGWGVVTGRVVKRREPKIGEPSYPPQESQFVDVLLNLSADSDDFSLAQPEGAMPKGISPESAQGESRAAVVPCMLTCLKRISSIRVFTPKDLTQAADREQVRRALAEVKRRFPDGLPLLDPIENIGITDESFKKLLRKMEVLESRLICNPLHDSPVLPDLYRQYKAKVRLGDRIKEKKLEIAQAHSIAQMDELKSRKRVLRRLGFINDGEVVQLKARVACEISSTENHELLLAELLFDRFFNELTPSLCAACLSCFILDERLEQDRLRPELDEPFRKIIAKARIIAKVSNECKIDLNEEEYVARLKPQLMDTVFAWAEGKSFADICKMTNAYEGSLIRIFRRLEELIRQMAQAANVMGSEELAQKFEECLKKIRRDIVAAQSLYL